MEAGIGSCPTLDYWGRLSRGVLGAEHLDLAEKESGRRVSWTGLARLKRSCWRWLRALKGALSVPSQESAVLLVPGK